MQVWSVNVGNGIVVASYEYGTLSGTTALRKELVRIRYLSVK